MNPNRLMGLLIVVTVVAMSLSCAKRPTIGPLERGIEHFENQDYAAAKEAFDLAFEQEPENPAIPYYLGQIALRDGDNDKAIELLEKAVSMDETNPGYHLVLGQAYVQKLQTVTMFEKATFAAKVKGEFEKAVEVDPEHVGARVALASFYLQAPPIAGGSVKKAKEHAEVIKNLDPTQGHGFMAQIYVKEKDYAAAEIEYEALVALSPDDPDIHYQLGMLHQSTEDFDKAFAAFEKALSLDPDHTASLYQMGRTGVFSGENLERCIECMKTYLGKELHPGNPSKAAAHWRLGMLYEKMGDKDLARKEYETALELEPENEEAKKSLEALE
ncbi:MAG: tetratricopeptide repeat protein [Candidatus Latescibacterota bacterium]|nr:MAG: tetratricopeptide repeat protein [Candidatus Latescibacterota bacterium]